MKGRLYLLFSAPVEGAVPTPLPEAIARETIGRSLWNSEEKNYLLQHTAHREVHFALAPNPIEAFLRVYREAAQQPHLIGIANPLAHTAHSASWARRLFDEGLEQVARETPPLHLWTGLLPVQVELSLEGLLAGQSASLWLRTAGYAQFGLPELAHPLQDLRETGWVHSLFELLFDWMYFHRHPLHIGEAIEIPERGRYLIEPFEEGVVALIEWKEEASESVP